MLSRSPVRLCLFVLPVFAWFISFRAGESQEQTLRKPTDADAIFALRRSLSFNFEDTPLRDVAEHFADVANMEVKLDDERLAEVGVGGDQPVTLAVRQMPVASALNHILRDIELAYTVRDGAIEITTNEALEHKLVERKYPVGDLGLEDPLWPDASEFDILIDAITMSIRPEMWEEVGGPGSLEVVGETLTVNQTFPLQAKVKQYLTALRKARAIAKQHPATPPPITSFWMCDGREKQIHAAMQKKTSYSFLEDPLSTVARELGAELGINVLLGARALEDLGLGDDTTVTSNIKHISAGAGLSLMLEQLDLVWEIRDGAVVITSIEEAESQLQVRIYPVLDLVRSPEAAELGLDDEFHNYDSLIDQLTATVRPVSWDVVGGPASVGAGGYGCLTISQTRAGFDEVDAFFKTYRQALKQLRTGGKNSLTPITFGAYQDNRLRRVLDGKVKPMAFDDAPLWDVAHRIAKTYHLPVQLDPDGMDWVGLTPNERITGELDGASLGDSLRKLLKPHALTWIVKNEVVLVTAREEASEDLVVKFYPIQDLVDRDSDVNVNARWLRHDQLHDAIVRQLAPDSWEDHGGPGSISVLEHPFLIVAQSEEVHQQLEELLNSLRKGEMRLADDEGSDPTRHSTNAKGEILFVKNYELVMTTVEETEAIAEILRHLVATRPWNSQDRYFIRASMSGSTIVVRHTAAMHRQIQRLLIDLEVLATDRGPEAIGGGLGDFGGWTPPISRLTALSLPASHPANTYGKPMLLQIVRLNRDIEQTSELIDEIRRKIEPNSWQQHAVTNAHCFRERLIIRHSPSVQRKILLLLKQKDAIFKPQPPVGGFF